MEATGLRAEFPRRRLGRSRQDQDLQGLQQSGSSLQQSGTSLQQAGAGLQQGGLRTAGELASQQQGAVWRGISCLEPCSCCSGRLQAAWCAAEAAAPVWLCLALQSGAWGQALVWCRNLTKEQTAATG